MDASSLLPFLLPAVAIACAAVAQGASALSTTSETKQASRVSRIESAVARVAGGIASDLVAAQQAGHAGDALAAIKSAAISEGASYLQSAMPATLQAAGATTESLIGMLTGQVGALSLTAAAPAIASAAVAALLPAAPAAPVTQAPAQA